MSPERIFGNWLVAIAEAAEVAGAGDLDSATPEQMTRAWGLVRKTANVSLDELRKRVATQAQLAVADLDEADSRAVFLIPAEVAYRRNILPLRCTDRDVVVATANPLSQGAKREIAGVSGRSVVFEIATPADLVASVERAYGPISDEERAAGPPPQVEATLPKGPHVLVVDDEAGQRALFRSILEEAGYRVDVVPDGPSAVEKLAADSSYVLVTLDYWMDKMNGLRVLQHIRSAPATREMPVIMVTGADDRQIEMSLFEAGADDYVAKPIDPPLFLLRIQAVLRRRRFA